MKLAVISFTRAGGSICRKLAAGLRAQGEDCRGYVRSRFADEEEACRDTDFPSPCRDTDFPSPCRDAGGTDSQKAADSQPWIDAVTEPVGDWTARMFAQNDALIYLGAAGIAVRALAPCLRDKMTDPAVLVCDEQGQFVISLLSGHVGGANVLAARCAALLGAQPVITTASDVQGLTAVDVWAKENHLVLSDRVLARQAAAALVNGDPVGFRCDYPLAAAVPAGYRNGGQCRETVWVTCKTPVTAEEADMLRLIPGVLTVGIGCRRQTEAQRVEQAVRQAFAKHHLDLRAIRQLASIDLKKEEPGICRTAAQLGVPFVTFPASELEAVSGAVSESSFVRSVTGTGTVCERAALRAADRYPASLWVKKEIYDGVTVAVAHEMTEIGAEQA